MSNFSKVGIFMKTFGQEVKGKPSFSTDKINNLRIDLIKEELEELKDAMKDKDLLEVADALTDILYVTYGAGHAFGINLDKCFDEVQNSNMSKLDKTEFPSILCGDFNADPNSDEIRLLLGLSSPINRTVLRDSWQLVNPDDHGYTWSNENNFARKTLEPNRRIDYIFVGAPGKNGLGHPLESCLIGNIEKDGLYPSDHFGIMTRFEG